MLDLIINGLNIGGSLAGIKSFISGYSIARNTEAILENTEKLQNRIYEIEKIHEANSSMYFEVKNKLDLFLRNPTPGGGAVSMQQIANYIASERYEMIADVRSILNESIKDIGNIINSINFSAAPPTAINNSFYRELCHHPQNIGVSQIRDITDGSLYRLSQPKFINNHSVPITWGNPMTGKMYLGDMPSLQLEQMGITVQVPDYPQVVDGHIYCHSSRLFLPEYIFRARRN